MRFPLGSVLLLATLALTYFGSILYAATYFPGGYSWRHDVMSSLANPRDDPQRYLVVSHGIAASGLVLALLGFRARRNLCPFAPRWTAWACGSFVLGGILLFISALITPGHTTFLGIDKAHAKIAQAAGVGFGLGLALNLPALLRLPPRHAWVRVTAVLLVVVPMTIYLLCRLILPLVEMHAPADQRDAIHHSTLASLAFWEWIGSSTVYLFLALITVALPCPRKSPESKQD
jgi:hypothetical protein